MNRTHLQIKLTKILPNLYMIFIIFVYLKYKIGTCKINISLFETNKK